MEDKAKFEIKETESKPDTINTFEGKVTYEEYIEKIKKEKGEAEEDGQ